MAINDIPYTASYFKANSSTETSLIAAFSVAAGVQGARRAWFANLLGLMDILIVTSSLALILLPQIGLHHSTIYAMILPAPLWLWFHLVSIWKLLHADARPSQVARV